MRVLSAVSFFQDAASEMLYPVTPLFLTAVLGAPVAVVGIIEGIAEGTASVLRAVSGRLADRRAKRPIVAIGYGVSSFAKLLIGLASTWPLVLVARVLDRVGKGVRGSPRDALIAEETPTELRGRAFGFHRAADTMGAVVGPLLGLALYEMLHHRIRPLYFIAFIPASLSVGLIFLVRERPRPVPSSDPATSMGRDRIRDLPAEYRRVVAMLSVFAVANFTDALLVLRAKALGLGFVGIILAYVLYNVVYAALGLPAGNLSDRIPRQLVFAGGLGFFAVAYMGLGLATSSAWVWVLFPVYGAYTALTDGIGRAWVADLLPARLLGTGLGLYGAVIGAGSVVAGVWAGLLWGSDGRLPLIVSGSVVGVLAILLVVRPAKRVSVAQGTATSS